MPRSYCCHSTCKFSEQYNYLKPNLMALRLHKIWQCHWHFWQNIMDQNSGVWNNVIVPWPTWRKLFQSWTSLCSKMWNMNVIDVTFEFVCLLLLIYMLWHRQVIFKSKGDKLSSSAECRIWTRGLIHPIASRLNVRWQTNWAIEDQAKNLNPTARPYDQRAFSPLDPTAGWLSHLALAIYMFVDVNLETRNARVIMVMTLLSLKGSEVVATSRTDSESSHYDNFFIQWMIGSLLVEK